MKFKIKCNLVVNADCSKGIPSDSLPTNISFYWNVRWEFLKLNMHIVRFEETHFLNKRHALL